MKRKHWAALLTAALLIPAGACGGGKPNEGSELNLRGYLDRTEMTRDYVYMWHRDGLEGSQRRVCLQSEDYALQVDAKYGDLIGAGVVDATERYVEADFDALPAAATEFFLDETGEGYRTRQRRPNATRLIDSGRSVNTMDYVYLNYQGLGDEMCGRVEYTATRTHFAVNYQMFAKHAEAVVDLKWSLALPDHSSAFILDGRGVTLLDANGNGFAFLKPTADSAVTISADKNELNFECRGVALAERTHAGFGIIGIPVKAGYLALVEDYLCIESLQVTAADEAGNLPVRFDADRGVFVIDTNAWAVGQSTAEGRDRLERIPFSIVNGGERAVTATLNFKKHDVSFPTTGISPLIRTADTLEPTGEQVQDSKNFHRFTDRQGEFNYAAADDPQRIFEGIWFHGYAGIRVAAGQTAKREYTCAYGNWGGVPAASHAQLCLIGWSANQLWDQSALGSWGESVTYDPDLCLGRSMIDDVRPLLVRATHGSLQEYNWSGNVGGGDFLNYVGEEQTRLVNQRVTYDSQGPNLTDVRYNGYTADGKIAADIRIHLGRTDDIVRNYYTIRYTFLEDVSYKRLSLFKIAADGYADNYFRHYAYGDENGVVKERQDAALKAGYQGAAADAPGDQFWFSLYDSPSEDEQADVLFTVRSFSAELNGSRYKRPSFRLFGTADQGIPQASCELALPAAAGEVIKKGSTVEMVVEYDVLPGDPRYYYGKADYLRATEELMGTATAAYQQVVGGTIDVEAVIGSVQSRYPAALEAAGGEVAAQFTLAGGLGYVPLRIDGLTVGTGWQLQVLRGGVWTDVVQSVNGGRDDYQAVYDRGTDSFSLSFNVKNVSELNFGAANEYRLIRRGV